MRRKPLWECEKCGKFVTHLFYCSRCWRMVCKDCYDHFVGVCKECVYELFYGNVNPPSENTERLNLQPLNTQEPSACPECGNKVVRAPDGTEFCSNCGIVIGVGYSWMGSHTDREDNAWHLYEYLYEKYLERHERLREKGRTVW